jgi:hypothetical protein
LNRARALLGWEPRVPLQQGLEATVAYFKVATEMAHVDLPPPPAHALGGMRVHARR